MPYLPPQSDTEKINSWHLTSRLTARSLSELDRECILGKVFFSLRGGVEFEFEFDAAAARSKSSSNCSGASSKASSNCVTASSDWSSSMWTASPDSESLFFFFPGGVRVRVRRGRRQVKIEFELLWGEFEREFELCHRQFELEFEHVDRESGLRKLCFFFRTLTSNHLFEFVLLIFLVPNVQHPINLPL